MKPIAGTESCQAPHLQYHVSRRLRVRMDDGSEDEFGPGEASLLPPGHDAWVVGNEPVVVGGPKNEKNLWRQMRLSEV